jgi:hypothetical protein
MLVLTGRLLLAPSDRSQHRGWVLIQFNFANKNLI